MTTDTTLPTAPLEERDPLIPHPLELEISDEEVRRFQQIMRETSQVELSFPEAKQRGLELLRLTLMLVDPEGYAKRLKEPPVLNRGLVAPPVAPAPIPAEVALPLEGDHARAIEDSLQRLAKELQLVKRRPTAWRWAVVALWDALAHALAAHRPAGFVRQTGLLELPRLFRAVSGEHPELPQVEQSVETINDLRTRHIAKGVTRWPVDLKKQLPGMFGDCLRVMRRLEPAVDAWVVELEAQLKRCD
jgi:hypothetical protein